MGITREIRECLDEELKSPMTCQEERTGHDLYFLTFELRAFNLKYQILKTSAHYIVKEQLSQKYLSRYNKMSEKLEKN